MISRIHGAHSTLAANPRRKKHKAKRNPHHRRRRNPEGVAASASRSSHKPKRSKSRKLFSFRAVTAKNKKTGKKYRTYRLSKNPTPMEAMSLTGGSSVQRRRSSTASKKRKGAKYGVFRSKSGFSVRKVKNPSLMIAGVPVIEMAIGSVAAIGIGAVAQIMVAKYAKDMVPAAISDITGELATAAVAAFAHAKLLKNPMHKTIAQYAFIGAVFGIIEKKAYKPLYNAIASPLGATPLAGSHHHVHGVYFDPYTAQGAVGGAYLPAMSGSSDALGGMYASVDGLGLFQSPSIYG
jgi:hypothetical protein